MGAPSRVTVTIQHLGRPGAGTRRRLPRVPVLLCWHRLHCASIPTIYERPRIQVSYLDTTPYPVYTPYDSKSNCNLTCTIIFDTTLTNSTLANILHHLEFVRASTSMYIGLEIHHEHRCYSQTPCDSTCNCSPFSSSSQSTLE